MDSFKESQIDLASFMYTNLDRLKEVSEKVKPQVNIVLDFWDTLPMMIVLVKGTTLVKVSSWSEKLLGWKPEEMEGKSYHDFIHPEDLEKTLEFEKFMKDHTTKEEIKRLTESPFVNRYLTKSGIYVPVFWRITSYTPEQLIAVACGGPDSPASACLYCHIKDYQHE